ncbi:hypothetical protein ABK040_003903 [Willaertia magna]
MSESGESVAERSNGLENEDNVKKRKIGGIAAYLEQNPQSHNEKPTKKRTNHGNLFANREESSFSISDKLLVEDDEEETTIRKTYNDTPTTSTFNIPIKLSKENLDKQIESIISCDKDSIPKGWDPIIFKEKLGFESPIFPLVPTLIAKGIYERRSKYLKNNKYDIPPHVLEQCIYKDVGMIGSTFCRGSNGGTKQFFAKKLRDNLQEMRSIYKKEK